MGRDLNHEEHMSTDNLPIVEFVGLPAAGKSTIAANVVNQLRDHEAKPLSPVAIINDRSTLYRVTSKLYYAVGRTTTAPVEAINTAGAAGLTRLLTTADARSVFLNWVFVRRLIECYSNTNRTIVLDQGLFQSYWSARLSEPDQFCNIIRKAVCDFYRDRAVLVVDIQVPTETITNRLRERDPNPSRITPNCDDKYTLTDAECAYSQTRNLINEVIERNNDAELLELTNTTIENLDVNIESILARIQEWS